jgi:hypothetical protein
MESSHPHNTHCLGARVLARANFGCCGEKIFFLPGIEPEFPDNPAHSPLTIRSNTKGKLSPVGLPAVAHPNLILHKEVFIA